MRKVKERSPKDAQVQTNGKPRTIGRVSAVAPPDKVGMPLTGDKMKVLTTRELAAKAQDALKEYAGLINELTQYSIVGTTMTCQLENGIASLNCVYVKKRAGKRPWFTKREWERACEKGHVRGRRQVRKKATA
jgi:hypothetical protein